VTRTIVVPDSWLSPRQGNPLLLASRELRRVVMFPSPQAHALQQLGRPLLGILASQFQRDLDVFLRCEGRDQVKGLEHESHPLAPETCPSILVEGGEILSVQDHATPGRVIQPREQAK
jgi:hypothetical protein